MVAATQCCACNKPNRRSSTSSRAPRWKASRGCSCCGDRIRDVDIVGGNHSLAGQPELVEQVSEVIADWILRL